MINNWKEYFTFTQKELNGIIVLCIILFLFLIAPFFFPLFIKDAPVDFSRFDAEVKKLEAKNEIARNHLESKQLPLEPIQLFNFNPNNLPASDWKKLGLSNHQIAIINNYESKGGHFNKKEDLKKIYGISGKQYTLLEPFILIPTNSVIKNYIPLLKEKKELVELNSADSILLVGLPDIGPVLASRIIKYRNKLGGFYSADQLKEVYGIDSLKFSHIYPLVKIDSSKIALININKVTFDDLRKHPYFPYHVSKSLINYRQQHAPFTKVEDIKQCVAITEALYKKVNVYLTLE